MSSQKSRKKGQSLERGYGDRRRVRKRKRERLEDATIALEHRGSSHKPWQNGLAYSLLKEHSTPDTLVLILLAFRSMK